MPELAERASASSHAAIRSALYKIIADSFRFPTQDFLEAIKGGQYSATLRTLLEATPWSGRHTRFQLILSSLVGFDGDLDDLCAEYIRLFEIGAERGKPPCPLYGGEYVARPRLDVMEEVVRFYTHFDLALSESDRELPDHASVELEFLHYLAFREHHALERGAETQAFRLAQADFIERQPRAWMPVLRDRLQAHDAPALYCAIAALGAEILEADLTHLRSLQHSSS